MPFLPLHPQTNKSTLDPAPVHVLTIIPSVIIQDRIIMWLFNRNNTYKHIADRSCDPVTAAPSAKLGSNQVSCGCFIAPSVHPVSESGDAGTFPGMEVMDGVEE